MKIYSILLFLILHCFAFGQSAEKLNKQLQADLLVEEQKLDSVYHTFMEKRRVLDEHRKKLRNRMNNEFDSMAQNLIGKATVIANYREAFGEMKIDEKGTLPDGFEDADSFPYYRSFVEPYDDPLRKLVMFKFPSPDVFITNDQELAEKNEVLKKFLQKYHTIGKENAPQFLKLDDFERKLAELEPRLDSLALVYQSWSNQLEKEEKLLFKRYLEARENYRLHGPIGFPESYRNYFGDIHPFPGEEQTVSSENGFEPVWVVDAGPGDEIYSKVDESAAYPDGHLGMMSYLRHNLVYPAEAKEKGITGRVCVDFVVSETGEITDVRIDRRVVNIVCQECEEEAVRLIESMPRWIPAVKNGYYVKSRHYEVVWFML